MKIFILSAFILALNACSSDSKSLKIPDGRYRSTCVEFSGTESDLIDHVFDGKKVTVPELTFENSDYSGDTFEIEFSADYTLEYSNVDLGNRVSYVTYTYVDASGETPSGVLFFVEGDLVYFAEEGFDVGSLSDDEIKETFSEFISSPETEGFVITRQ
jgi:hypothetical protein